MAIVLLRYHLRQHLVVYIDEHRNLRKEESKCVRILLSYLIHYLLRYHQVHSLYLLIVYEGYFDLVDVLVENYDYYLNGEHDTQQILLKKKSYILLYLRFSLINY